LAEEHVGHVDVMMLAGVDKYLRHIVVPGESWDDRGRFHEAGPGAHDVKDVHKPLAVSLQHSAARRPESGVTRPRAGSITVVVTAVIWPPVALQWL